MVHDDGIFVRPVDLAAALVALDEHEDAVVLAGSTDLGVEVNLRGSRPAYVVAVDRLPELRELSTADGRVTIGAALTLSEVEEALAGRVPLLDEVWPQFASRLIRNGATIGGNLGTASPIGDLAPALLALDATLVLVSSAGEREVPLADYFTGYRQTRRSRAELIRAVRLPEEQPGIVAFHKIAKRRYDDISSVAVAFALDVTDGVVTSVRIGLGGVAATPIRALRTELALAGQPWTEESVEAAAAVLAEEGTPIDDQRASAAYRSAMLGNSLRKLSRDHEERVMTSLSERPGGAVVGVEMEHESAALHVTGQALYTDDLVGRTTDVLHAHPVQAPHAHARVTAIRADAAYDVPGVVRVLTAGDVPGLNDAGVKHDEPLFPDEVMYHGHAVVWVLGETLEAARRGAAAIEVDYEPLPSLVTIREAIAAGSFQGGSPTVERGDVEWAFDNAAHVFTGETEMAGQEHFYLETHASLALVDEGGQVFVQCSTQHPTETQEIVAHVLGVQSHEVTVQCLRMGGGFGGKEMQPHGFAAIAALGATITGRPVRLRLPRQQDITMTGKRHGFHAEWKVGFDEDGRLLALDGHDHLRWRVEPRPVRAGAGPRAVPHRQRLLDPARAGARPHREDEHHLADGLPGLRRPAGDARDRGRARPVRAAPGSRPGRPAAPQLLRRRAGHAVRPAGPASRPARRRLGAGDRVGRPRRAAGRDRGATTQSSVHTKRALAITPVKFGISFNFTAFNQAGALVHVYKDGSVLINHGGTEMGQGLHTKMLQVAATALGLPLARVRLAPTRTDKVPNTSATAASAGADLNGARHQGRLRADPGPARAGPRRARHRLGRPRARGLLRARAAVGGRLLPHRGTALGRRGDARLAVQVLRVRRLRGRGRGRRLHRRLPHPPRRHRPRRRRLALAAGRPRPGRGRLRPGRRLADPGGPALGRPPTGPSRGRLTTQSASTYKLPSLSEMPEDFRVAFLDRAHEDGAVYGSKAVGEPPLMLALAVREALREAAAASGRRAPASTWPRRPRPRPSTGRSSEPGEVRDALG